MFTKKKNFDLFLHCSFLLTPVALKLFEIFPRRTQKELSSKMSRLFYNESGLGQEVVKKLQKVY